jgi:CTP synthase
VAALLTRCRRRHLLVQRPVRNQERTRELLADFNGVLVLAAWVRGVEGMSRPFATRESGLPFFGICLGMQTAIIEFARNVMGPG